VLSLEKAAVRLFGPGGRLPGSSTNVMHSPNNWLKTLIIGRCATNPNRLIGKMKNKRNCGSRAAFFILRNAFT